MTTEADTCRNDILPKLYAADLENDPHSIAEQDVETRTPVILTSSQLLTTSIDERICCNVVLVRLANSIIKFKQIIGRGARVLDDYSKLWFNPRQHRPGHAQLLRPGLRRRPRLRLAGRIDEYGQTRRTTVLTPEESQDEAILPRRKSMISIAHERKS